MFLCRHLRFADKLKDQCADTGLFYDFLSVVYIYAVGQMRSIRKTSTGQVVH